jgi:predicted MFS family arabinose efflux permease
MTSTPSTPIILTQALVLLMATATGIVVAGNYYAQPLLHTIAAEFVLTQGQAGTVVTTAQLSYGVGLILLVPLADILERRRLIFIMLMLASIGLVISGFAPNLPWLLFGTALTGISSVVAQVLVPFAATLAAPEQRGRVIGILMGGLLLGILLARVVAGGLSTLVDWRFVYWIAALAIFIVAVALTRALPRYRADSNMSYKRLLMSVIILFVEEPILRHRALLGLISFALFSMFWTPLSFLLAQPPYEYSDAVIGLFGFAGAAGVMAASWAGRFADAGKGELGTRLGLITLLLSWIPLYYGQVSLIALLAGVILLDLAVQFVHVSNQNVIYALRSEIRNRLNAGYMTCYFIGGALGSWLSVTLYQHFAWTGVCVGAAIIAILGILIGVFGGSAAKAAQQSS